MYVRTHNGKQDWDLEKNVPLQFMERTWALCTHEVTLTVIANVSLASQFFLELLL